MAATPTIVAASLDSKDLEKSINDLVSKVNEGTKQMADNFTTQVERMQSALKNLGATKVEFGSGGKANPVELQKELEAQAKKTTQATKEQTMTYDQMSAAVQRAVESTKGEGLKKFFDRNELQSYIELLRNLQAEYIKVNTTEGGGAKSDRIKAEMQALEQIIAKYQDILKNLDYVNSRQGTIDIRKWIQDLTAVDDRYSKLTRWYSVLEKEDQRRIDNEAKANKKRLEDLEKEQRARDKMVDSARKAEEKYQNGVLKDAWRNALTLPVESIEQAKTKIAEIERLKNTLRSIDIIKDADVNRADALIARLRKQYNIQRDNANAQQGTWTNIGGYRVNQTKEGLNELNAAVERNRRNAIRAEEDKRAQIILTGLTAQQTARTIAESMSAQIDKGGQITQLKELEEAWRQMMQALQNMTQEQLRSPLGDMMLETVAKTELAIAAVKKYNEEIKNTATQQQSKNVGSSYSELSETLKSLTATYHNYNSEQRNNATLGIAVADRIHRINQELRDIQRQMNRPTSLKKALGMDESTLDHISDKIQALRSYRSGLKLTDPKSVEEMRQVDAEINRLTKDMDKYMGRGQQMVETNTALGRSWNYMKNRLAFYFTVGASTSFVKSLIEVRSQYEMNERALGILINSAERGTQIFNELSQMALVSPYTLIELSSAAKQLTAYDIAAKDVVDTTRRLADMASAVGVPMERLTYALGQIKAYGYLNSRDARMFANAGIPLVKQLSDYYTELEGKMVSVGDVYDRMKKKAIDYNSVMAVITKMTDEGGKFFDFQAKMADTLKVRLANLTLAWNNMLNEMGKETQGVLTTGINLLKELFLRWKDINNALTSLAWTFGILKAAHLAYYLVVRNTNNAIALETVLGQKLAGVMKTVYASFKTIITSPLTWWTLLVAAVGSAVVALAQGNTAMKEFNKSIREGAKDNFENLSKFLEQYQKVRNSLTKKEDQIVGKSPYGQNIVRFDVTVPVDIDNNEAKKVWEAVREQIELTTKSSDEYIGYLLQIENVSERLRQGFDILKNVKEVSAALKEIGDDGITVTREWSAWWNLWIAPDGLIANLKDYKKEVDEVVAKFGSIQGLKDNAYVGGKNYSELRSYEDALQKFRDDLDKTTDSILKFIDAQEWSGDVGKINEVFKQITDKLINENQLDPQMAYTLQLQVEEARSKAVKQALIVQSNDLVEAWKIAEDEKTKESYRAQYERVHGELESFDQFNGRNKVEWERFSKWMKERHLAEMTEMFRGLDAKQIESLNFQEGKYADWVKRMVENYAKSHKMSYDDAFNYLRNWVTNANKWSIFIPLTISTEEGKSVYETLEEADKAADDAFKTMERLDKEISRLRKKGAKEATGQGTAVVDTNALSEDDKKLTKALQERADAQKAYDDAIAAGGRSKKEDAANTKAQKAAETELQKALKDEIQLIEQVRSQYKKLTDAGVKRGTALTMVTTQFGASIEHINKILQKNGLPKFDIRTFAGTDDPHAILAMLKAQIDKAKTSSNIKPEEIKALEVEVGKVTVDTQVYDTTKITKGLNNELDKLKDEYELAIELDANPELGGMFADMFGIDLDTLPRTAKEYADAYTKSLNKYFKQMGANIELPNMLNLTRNDMEAFTEQLGAGKLQQVYFDLIQKGYEATQEARKKEATDAIKEYEKLIQKYSEYQYKLTQIAKEANNERKALVVKFGTDEQKEKARKIVADIELTDDSQKKEELKKQLIELVDQVVKDDDVKVQLKVAIDNKEFEDSAQAAFEEFQKRPEWLVATGDIATMTNDALKSLVKTLDDYQKKGGLTEKQTKQINKAMSSLHKEIRKNNPFNVITDMLDQAKERASLYDAEIEKTKKSLKELKDEQAKNGKLTDEQAKKYKTLSDRLQELTKLQKEAGKVDFSVMVQSLKEFDNVVKDTSGLLTDMMGALSGNNANDAIKQVENLKNLVSKTAEGARIGSNFGGYGAAIGAAAGFLTSMFENYGDDWSGNLYLNKQVEKSKIAIKQLTNEYKNLQYAIDDAYGMAVYGAKRTAIANKELQLAELKRQLQLEESRRSKNYDEEKVEDLKGQIIDLENEIKKATKEIVTDMLGITSVSSAAETLVTAMVTAFKKGEDYMDEYKQSFSDMIDSMIVKAITSKVIGDKINEMVNDIEKKAKERADQQKITWDDLTGGIGSAEWENLLKAFFGAGYGDYMEEWEYIPTGEKTFAELMEYVENRIAKATTDAEKKRFEEYREKLQKMYTEALTPTPEDITAIGEKRDQWQAEVKEIFDAYMEAFGIEYGQDKTKTALSALKQGISGITETQAGALEAYWNANTQQQYVQSDLLTQIRDTVVGLTMDAGLGVQTQMLFQLQQSYLVQQSIEGMMRGVLSPSERAFQVEIIS